MRKEGRKMMAGEQEDQVVRQTRFHERHPGVTIIFDRDAFVWNASWPGGENGTRKITRPDLGMLLDALEEEFGH
jgi:hypothetical protein